MAFDFLTRARSIGAPFRRLMWSDALTLLALMVGHVTLPWWIAHEGGAADLAVYGVAVSAMSFIAMPLLSPLGDRYPKRRLIALALGVYALAAFGLAAVASAGHYHLGWLIGLALVPAVAMAVVVPAVSSIAAELEPPERLTQALALQQSAQSIGRLIGPALGGAVLAAGGTAAALWLHFVLLIGAAAMALRLPATPKRAAAGAPRGAWYRDMQAGVRANWAIPLERGWTLVNFVSSIFMFPALTMLVPLKVQSLGLSATWLGLCEAALSLGMLVGGLGFSQWWVARQGRHATRITAAALQGCALAAAGATAHPVALVLAFGVAGLGVSATVLVGMTHRMLARPLAFRARMSAGSIMTNQIAATLGPALAGLALLRAPVGTVHAAFGLLGAVASLGLLLVPGFRAFMNLRHDEADGWYGRAYPEAFARVAGEGGPALSQRGSEGEDKH